VFDGEHHCVRVEKDVKAVLLGNRTAEDLHNAWIARKFKAYSRLPLVALRNKYPTALLAFCALTPEDQEGYNLFVRTVKETYAELTKEKPVGNSLEALAKKCQRSTVTYPDCEVVLLFNNSEDAQAFWKKLGEV
jgi:hypothetical protein